MPNTLIYGMNKEANKSSTEQQEQNIVKKRKEELKKVIVGLKEQLNETMIGDDIKNKLDFILNQNIYKDKTIYKSIFDGLNIINQHISENQVFSIVSDLYETVSNYNNQKKQVQIDTSRQISSILPSNLDDIMIDDARKILKSIEGETITGQAKQKIQNIKTKIGEIQDKVSEARKILSLAIEAKDIYDKYINGEEDSEDKKDKNDGSGEKSGTGADIEIDKLKKLKLKGLIKGAKNIQEMVQNINTAIESGYFTQEEKRVLQLAIKNLEDLDKVVLPKIDDELNEALDKINTSTFPIEISILGRKVYFNTKEQAINAIKTIKEELGAGRPSMLYNYSAFLVYLLTAPSQPGYQLSKPLFKWGVLEQKQDIKDHIEGEEWEYLVFTDFGAALLTIMLIGNINSTISFALRESVGRTFKNTAGRLGMNLMEDYSNNEISTIDLEGIKAQEYQEFIQREAILKGLKKYIESVTDNDLKEELKRDYKRLEKYKLIKGSEFFFKANLIANEVGLKNFKNLKYYRNLGLSAVNGARFFAPSLHNYWKEGEGLGKLKIWKYIKWINMTKGISFQKQILTNELESIIEDGLEDIKEEMNKYFEDVLIEKADDNDYKIEVGEVKKEFLEKIKAYINGKTNITEEERKRLLDNLEGYLKKISANNILISEEGLGQQITKLVDKRYLTYDEIKDIILKDEKFKDFLKNREIKNYVRRNKNIEKRFFGKNKKFIKLITMLKEGKIEGNEKTIKKILEDFLDGKDIKENHTNIDNNLTDILDEGERNLKSIEKAKRLFKGELYINLRHIINLDSRSFPDDKEKFFEELFEELERKIESGELQYTEKQLLEEFLKVYNGFVTNDYIEKVLENKGEDFVKKKNVKDFILKYKSNKWMGTKEELRDAIIKLENGEIIEERYIEFGEDIKQEIKTKGERLQKLDFKNPKYGLPTKEGFINTEELKNTELRLAEFYHKIKGTNFEKLKFNIFVSNLENGIDYRIKEYYRLLSESLGIRVKIAGIQERGDYLESMGKDINDYFIEVKDVIDNKNKSVEEKKEKILELEDKLGKPLESLIEVEKEVLRKGGVEIDNILKSYREFRSNEIKIEEQEKQSLQEKQKQKTKKLKKLNKQIRQLQTVLDIGNISELKDAYQELYKVSIELGSIEDYKKQIMTKLIELKLKKIQLINPEQFKLYLEEVSFEELLKEYHIEKEKLETKTKEYLEKRIETIRRGDTKEAKRAQKEWIEKIKEIKRIR